MSIFLTSTCKRAMEHVLPQLPKFLTFNIYLSFFFVGAEIWLLVILTMLDKKLLKLDD